ncbi:MAG: InlB B-repeat-containing protein [Chitinispirillia bacterium]|nr:InlB B-repeat-containing protein [Chitinispirillia bacterium]MCL2241620.1 InlB B-repeat-containing protein [Chitinispirillia bacterium]
MKNNKNLQNYGIFVCLIAVMCFFACESPPDYCSRGNRYDPKMQFCFAGKAYQLCSNGEYNPLTEGCNPIDNTVGTRCLDSTYVKPGSPCGGYTLTTGSAPANGGSVQRFPDLESYAADERVTLTATAEDGYTFTGWVGVLTSANASLTLTMNSNNPVVAMFSPVSAPGATEHTLAVTAFPEHGGTTNHPSTATYTAGTQVSVTASALPGYSFAGWSGASTSKSSPVNVTMDGGKTLVAMFTPIVYTLTARSNPANGGTVFVDGTALAGGTQQGVGTKVNVLAQPAEGYEFTGWSLDGAAISTNISTEITISSSNQTLTANFRERQGPVTPPNATYTLTVNAETGGSITPSGTSTHNANTPVTITATASSGYEFSNWRVIGGGTVANANNRSTTVTLTGDATVTAIFRHSSGPSEPGMVSLTIISDPAAGGTVFVNDAVSPGTTYHPEDTQVTVRAEAVLGYRFMGWEDAPTASATRTVNMRRDVALTAKFDYVGTRTLTINMAPANGGAILVNNVLTSGVTSHTRGDSVIVRAVASAGYIFTEWFGASTSKNPTITITMDSDLTLTANFDVSVTGSFTDNRDGKSYRTVKIGGNVWMAENLNTRDHIWGDSWCYDNDNSNCEKYGRLYDWEAAVRDACPVGWRLPDNQDWNDLVETAGGYITAGNRLKSQTDWVEYSGISSTDEYGFSALPGGSRDPRGNFHNAGSYGYWWSATEYGTTLAWYRRMYYNYDYVNEDSNDKSNGFSVRCVEDNAAQR